MHEVLAESNPANVVEASLCYLTMPIARAVALVCFFRSSKSEETPTLSFFCKFWNMWALYLKQLNLEGNQSKKQAEFSDLLYVFLKVTLSPRRRKSELNMDGRMETVFLFSTVSRGCPPGSVIGG